jgi:hypothetical protein
VWSDTADEVTQGAIPDPQVGSDLMLTTTTGDLSNLVVVDMRGVTHHIASNVFLGQIGPCPDCSAY